MTRASLNRNRLNLVETGIFVFSFVYFYIYIVSYGLTLDSDEISHINFIYQLLDKGVIADSLVKPLPLLLAFSGYFFSPFIYELITVLFTALLVLYIYKLGAVLFSRPAGLLASIFVLLNPVTFTLTMGGNSIIIQASLLFMSFHYLLAAGEPTDKNMRLSFLTLFLSCLTRPESLVLVPVMAVYALKVKRFQGMKIVIWYFLLFVGALFIWLFKDYIITGDPLWTSKSLSEYAKTVRFNKLSKYGVFPTVFMRYIYSIFISVPFISMALLGFLVNIKNMRNASILPLAFLLIFAAYWILAGRGAVIVPRFFYIPYLVIAIYSSAGIFYISDKLLLLRADFIKVVLTFSAALFLLYLTEMNKISDSRKIMQLTAEINKDIIKSTQVLKAELSKNEGASILLSSRRIPLTALEMRDYNGLRFISYRQFYGRREVAGQDIDWIILDMLDMYPNTEVNRFIKRMVFSENELLSRGVKLNRVYNISQRALLLSVSSE